MSKIVKITPEEFDTSRVVMTKPETVKYIINNTEVPVTYSQNRYKNDAGEICDLYVEAPQQMIGTFGLAYNYPMDLVEEEKKPHNATGMQLCYPITSMKTVKEPTPQEQAFKNMLESMWNLTCDHAKAMYEEHEDEEFLPGPAANSISAVVNNKKNQDWKKAVKYPYDAAKFGKDSKMAGQPDPSKPAKLYAKLVSTGKQDKLSIKTRFYMTDEDGIEKQVSPMSVSGVNGNIVPLFKWDQSFWGAHGQKSPVGVSMRLKLAEALFYPVESSDLPAERMLRAAPRKTEVPKVAQKKSVNVDSDEEKEPEEEKEDSPVLAKKKPVKKTKKGKKSKMVESDDE